MPKNECKKIRPIDNPYEIWVTPDKKWEWRVLKKYQVNNNAQFARYLCAVKSPYTWGDYETGDVYVKDLKEEAMRIK